LPLRTNCGYPRWETPREEVSNQEAWRPRPNRPVPARAATPDLESSDLEEWDDQSTFHQNPERPALTAESRMPAGGFPVEASPKAEDGWLDPPMQILRSDRVWTYSWARPVPARAAEPNGQILDLGAIRSIGSWGKNGVVLKWRRWRVAYPEMHNQVPPDATSIYSVEELEERRLRNQAEEQIADQEARQRREAPAAPAEEEYIARCMRLWGGGPERQPDAGTKKRVYEEISDASTQDGESVGEPESPAQEDKANHGVDEPGGVDQDKPTQSDCMSVDYSPYSAEDPEERAGATPVPPGGNATWEDES